MRNVNGLTLCNIPESPPLKLQQKFREITGELSGILALYYAGYNNKSFSSDTISLERTEGRQNIIELVPKASVEGAIQTAWLPDRSGAFPVQMTCVINCDSRTTRFGGVHKGTKSHTTQ